ncbi:MAG: tetratricopeptide repeat protein [Bdellovibrionales bacterium]|nr:tetratricopeptide repeat protein [Bdellovibrionales bacterium]
MKSISFILLIALLACSPIRKQDNLVNKHKANELIDIGVINLRNFNFEKAKAAFQVSYKLTASAPALDGLGCVALLEKNYKLAQQYFLDAYKFDSEYYYALANLAFLYQTLGNVDAAQVLYKKALQKNPDNFRARNNYAGILRSDLSEFSLSREELQKAAIILEHPIVMANLNRSEDQ